MANLKISQLPTAATATTSDQLAVVNAGVTSKITLADIINLSAFGLTGNTSGTCISDIYVTNIHSCSPLNIYDGNQQVATFEYTNGFQLVDGVNMVVPSNSEIVDGSGTALVSAIKTTDLTSNAGFTGVASRGWEVKDFPDYVEVFSGTSTGVTATTMVIKTFDVESKYNTESLYKVVGTTPSIRVQTSSGYDIPSVAGMFTQITGGLDNLNRGNGCGVCNCCGGNNPCSGSACDWPCLECGSWDNPSVALTSFINKDKTKGAYTLKSVFADGGIFSNSYLHSDYSIGVNNSSVFSIDSSSGSDEQVITNASTIIDSLTGKYIQTKEAYNTESLTINERISGNTSGSTATTRYDSTYDLINGYKKESVYKFISGSHNIKSQRSEGYGVDYAGMFYQIGGGVDMINTIGTPCAANCEGYYHLYGADCKSCGSPNIDSSLKINSFINDAMDSAFYITESVAVDSNLFNNSYLHSDFTTQIINQKIFFPDGDGSGESIKDNIGVFDSEYNIDYITSYKPKAYTTTATYSGGSSGMTATTRFVTTHDISDAYKSFNAYSSDGDMLYSSSAGGGCGPNNRSCSTDEDCSLSIRLVSSCSNGCCTPATWAETSVFATPNDGNEIFSVTQGLVDGFYTAQGIGDGTTYGAYQMRDFANGTSSQSVIAPYWTDGFTGEEWGSNSYSRTISGSTTAYTGTTLVFKEGYDLINGKTSRHAQDEECNTCLISSINNYDTDLLLTTETWTGATTASTATTINMVKTIDLLTAGYKTEMTRGADPVVAINHIFTDSLKSTHIQNSKLVIDETNGVVEVTDGLLRLKTIPAPPASVDAAGTKGDFYIASDDNAYFYNGVNWRRITGAAF